MSTVRRVYTYVVAAAGLLVLAIGVVNLGQALVVAVTSAGDELLLVHLRRQVAEGGAAATVGLPVWLLHWAAARRAARHNAAERATELRRLYLYVVLAVATVAAWLALESFLTAVFGLLVAGGAPAPTATQVALPVPLVLVAAAIWWYHRRTAAQDRVTMGELGGGATLRRWYRYGIAFVTLAALLGGASATARFCWEIAVAGGSGAAAVAAAAATAISALVVWLPLWRGWAIAPAEQRLEMERHDAASTLRLAHLFLALALSVVMALMGAWQVLFYALGRVLGVASPGGAGGSLLLAAAGPVSVLLIYGVSWLYQRRALAVQARAQAELPEQAGVRRLYTYLVAFVALGVLAAGAGGLLWTLADMATEAPQATAAPEWWRDRVSLYVALAAVGLPVWLLHWRWPGHPTAGAAGAAGAAGTEDGRAARAAGEVGSLARRLYVYLALLAGVLALLGAGVAAVKQVYDLALGAAATAGTVTNLARALSVAVVAGIAVVYHQRVLRTDARIPRPAVAAAGPLAPAPTPNGAAPAGGLYPFGVITHGADGSNVISWYATTEGAREAYRELRRRGVPAERVVLVRVEDEWPATAAVHQTGVPPAATPVV